MQLDVLLASAVLVVAGLAAIGTLTLLIVW
jgi:hypothetical protein